MNQIIIDGVVDSVEQSVMFTSVRVHTNAGDETFLGNKEIGMRMLDLESGQKIRVIGSLIHGDVLVEHLEILEA